MTKSSFVYILANWNNKVIYIGITNDVECRLWEHKNRQDEGFTKKYNLDRLVYYENFFDIESAISREKQLKGWNRKKKNQLIESMNPAWKDLSEDWYKSDMKKFNRLLLEEVLK